jgi:hypothetical protein
MRKNDEFVKKDDLKVALRITPFILFIWFVVGANTYNSFIYYKDYLFHWLPFINIMSCFIAYGYGVWQLVSKWDDVLGKDMF